MSSFEEVINYTSDDVVKTVWYSEERQELMVELYNGECITFFDVPENVVKDFQMAECRSLEDFYNDCILEEYDSLPS